MTPRSLPRAVERKLTQSIQPAAAPAPSPNTGQCLAAGENVEDFFQLITSLLDHYHPATTHEHSLVEDLACERWFLLRRQRAFNVIEARLFSRKPDPAAWSEADFKRLAQADRHRIQAERTFHRALKRTKEFRKERVANHRWEAMYDMAVRHLEFEKKKHEHQTGDPTKRMDIAA
jgi:hypothetical protein